MTITVNALLELINEVDRRLSDLRSIRSSVTVVRKDTYGVGDNLRVTDNTPQYDAKAVDLKITTLETWLFKAKSAIKQSNATTTLGVDGEVDVLLAPLS
jgi:hypothetical protein